MEGGIFADTLDELLLLKASPFREVDDTAVGLVAIGPVLACPSAVGTAEDVVVLGNFGA
jgi:hypothetical protein